MVEISDTDAPFKARCSKELSAQLLVARLLALSLSERLGTKPSCKSGPGPVLSVRRENRVKCFRLP